MEETKKKEKLIRDILPASGVWTVEDLARYLGRSSGIIMQNLSDSGIMVLPMGKLYRHKIIRLEDLKPNKPEEEK